MKQSTLVAMMSLLTLLGSMQLSPAFADRYYRNQYRNGYDRPYVSGYTRYGYQHPYLKSAGIGTVGGAALGGLIAPDGDRVAGAVKGGLLGAGAGLGYQWLKRR